MSTRKKGKKTFGLGEIKIKKGLVKNKIKKVNLANYRSGVRSNDNTPHKKNQYVSSRDF